MTSRKRRHHTLRASLAAGAIWLAIAPSYAVDLNSQDLIPAPAGTDAILGYFTYAARDSFSPLQGGALKQGTGLDSFVGIFRYVHYMDIGGFKEDLHTTLRVMKVF
ncbi:hypothetical protein ABRZ24_20285 [Brenneria populi]|uniref:Uncharacterized protein n=1 Tax=Brenneria populi TaxID=1505588 RepID=A0ABU6JWL8_9GAMM|nr:hypothetical protein [Brenneria populi Li et al. 2015]